MALMVLGRSTSSEASVTFSVEVTPFAAPDLLKFRRYGNTSVYFSVATKETVSGRVKMDEATDGIRYGPNYHTMRAIVIRYDTDLVLELVNDDDEEVLASLQVPLCSPVIEEGEESDGTLHFENFGGAFAKVRVSVTAQYHGTRGRPQLEEDQVVAKRPVRGRKKVAAFLGKVMKAVCLAAVVLQGFLD